MDKHLLKLVLYNPDKCKIHVFCFFMLENHGKIIMKNNKIILWDWNGTLLNDMDACISSMNDLLKKKDIETVDYSRNRDIFTFPVQE